MTGDVIEQVGEKVIVPVDTSVVFISPNYPSLMTDIGRMEDPTANRHVRFEYGQLVLTDPSEIAWFKDKIEKKANLQTLGIAVANREKAEQIVLAHQASISAQFRAHSGPLTTAQMLQVVNQLRGQQHADQIAHGGNLSPELAAELGRTIASAELENSAGKVAPDATQGLKPASPGEALQALLSRGKPV